MKHFEIGIKGTDFTSTRSAETAGKAKYSYLLDARDGYPDLSFKHLTCRRVASVPPTKAELAQREADAWNAANPIGTVVDYWRGLMEGGPSGRGVVYHEATVICDHAVAWIKGCSGCVSLSHVRAVTK